MTTDDELAQWAAQFLQVYAEEDGQTDPPQPQEALPPSAAAELLRSVDIGGVPAFITANLRKIAEEHGIEISASMTPNDIVAAIRSKMAC
jgi:hypothetical protein